MFDPCYVYTRIELLRFIEDEETKKIRNKNGDELFSEWCSFAKHTARPGDTGTWVLKK